MNNYQTQKKYLFPFFSALFFTLAIVISWAELAVAQLRLGSGVQPGLEGYIVESQLQGLPLNKIRGINGCSVGFGVSCNKTAAILQQIIQEFSGRTYDDLLIQAVGGLDNYKEFIQFYPQSTALIPSMPLNSFWVNGDRLILDSYQNSGIEILSPKSIPNLHEIVSRFRYAPVTWDYDSLNLRQGLIGLKTAYGMTLVEEALKIPEIEDKIATFGLNETETAFHLKQFRQAVAALNSNSTPNINFSLFQVLSNPYTNIPAEFNRPFLNISQNSDWFNGIVLEGEEQAISNWLPGEGNEIVLLDSPNLVFNSINLTPVYVVSGISGFTFLTLLLIDDLDSNSSNSLPRSHRVPDILVPPIANSPNPTINLPIKGSSRIPEPSNIPGIIVVAIVGLIFCRKRIKG
jgi:hypothetical protein